MATKLTNEMIEQLKKPLDAKAVSKHPTKPYLSTIKAIYEVERLNEVFGLGCWYLKDEIIEKDEKMVIVKATLTVPEYDIEFSAYGGNDNSDRGDAYKGAVTDALTKICSYMYIGMDVFKGQHDDVTKAALAKADKEVKPVAKVVKKERTEEQKAVDGFSVMTDVTKNSIISKLKEIGKDYDRTPFTKRGITTMESFKAFAKDTGELLTEQDGLDILKELYIA